MKKKTEEEKIERRKRYYQENKERIREYERNRRKNMTEEQREAKRAYLRDYYRKKNGRIRRRKEVLCRKKRKDVKLKKHSNCKLAKYPNGIYLLEYSIKKAKNQLCTLADKYLDDNENFHLKRELERLLYKVDQSEKIVIIESNSIQVYLKDNIHVDEISEIVEEFASRFIFNNKNTEEEIKEKKEKKSKHNLKPVHQYTLDGQFIAEYPSGTEAARKVGIAQGSICQVCNGKMKTAGGFVWKYAVR